MTTSVIIGDKTVNEVLFCNDSPIALICGPCAIESYDLAMETAELLCKISDELKIGIVYKSSFDKANRTSIDACRGVGMEEGLKILSDVRCRFNIPVLTDIHDVSQVAAVAEVVDALQIPALLCRQTDLITAAARSGKPVNIKKGQFLSPSEMIKVADKARKESDSVLLTERGTSFGYNNLVSDMRAIRIMEQTELPVIFDATHSVQLPGGSGNATSGQREFIEPLARAACAVGVAGFFMESHPRPNTAISDGPTMVPMHELKSLLVTLQKIDAVTKSCSYGKNIR